MTADPSPPIVAIVGRPNVGKSTLFNRLAGSRRALVADSPGVTRDRITQEVEVAGRRLLLVDTAGLEPRAREHLSSAIQAQARSAVEEADAILFVVDGQSGLLPEDASIAKTLRRTDKPLALVVNKIDVPAHASRIADFHQLGFEMVMGVSAEHGTGAFDALEALAEKLPLAPAASASEQVPTEADEIRVALVGRPNVGKSSLTNRLLGSERVVVSDIPGTTRDSVDLRLDEGGQRYVLVDTAGLRRVGRRERGIEQVSALMTVRSLERAQVALLLIDASEGFSDQDAHVANLIRERGCAAVVLANKWDQVNAERSKQVLEGIRRGLRFMSDAPLIAISAKTGASVQKIFPKIRQVFEAGGLNIPTAELNRWLEETVAKHEPSMARRGYSRRPIKFFYATQTSSHPPTFVLFCTDPKVIRPAYRRFLENRLRERFRLEGTPVRLVLRARSAKKKAKGGNSSGRRG